MTLDKDTGLGLFVYDRPEHTRRVLAGLEQNDVDHLYVFADGPGPDADEDAVTATREVIRDIDFCTVELVERSKNYGVERSWTEGYDHVFDRHNKAIMLESDCVPAPDFVAFMQACLHRYEDDPKVMNVHGYCPPIDIPDSYSHDIFFTWRSGSWGQATWKDAWAQFERDPGLVERIKNDRTLRKKIRRAGWDVIPMLQKEVAGELDSVGVWWGTTLALNEGVSVNPIRTRVENVGLDGSGRHSDDTDRYDTELRGGNSPDSLSFPPSVEVNEHLNDRYVSYTSGSRREQIAKSLKHAVPDWLRNLV